LISFSALAIPGSQASPMAQLPPVPFPYITGPVVSIAGPVNTVPTFAVDIARVNAGVGGAGPEQSGTSATSALWSTPPTSPTLLEEPTLLVPSFLQEPLQGFQEDAATPIPTNFVAPDEPLSAATWTAASTAYFAADVAPRPPEVALPLSIDATVAQPQPDAVMSMVAILGAACWWYPERASRDAHARRRSLPAGPLPV